MKQLVATVAAVLWSSAGLCDLPAAVIKAIENQSLKFRKVLDTSTPAQRRLTLERYADLLLQSPFTFGMKVNKEELFTHLGAAFPSAQHKQVAEMPRYSASIDNELAHIARAFQGEFKDGLLHLKFKCEEQDYEFPFTIESAGPIAFSMSIHGVPVQEEVNKVAANDRCLETFFVAKSLPATAATINTANVACPLPPRRAGTCVLNFLEQIVTSTKRERVKLTDGSKIRCISNHQPTSLWHLRVYQGRPTWYEKNGYQVVEKIRVQREAAVKAARTYTLSNLLSDINTPKDIPMQRAMEATELLKKYAKELDDPTQDMTVAQFMSVLWEKDCAAYVLIDELITWPIRGYKYGALFPSVDEFEKVLHNR